MEENEKPIEKPGPSNILDSLKVIDCICGDTVKIKTNKKKKEKLWGFTCDCGADSGAQPSIRKARKAFIKSFKPKMKKK